MISQRNHQLGAQLAAGLVALALASGPLLRTAHDAEVAHTWCEAHQHLVHADTLSAPGDLPAPGASATASAAPESELDESCEQLMGPSAHPHRVCAPGEPSPLGEPLAGLPPAPSRADAPLSRAPKQGPPGLARPSSARA